MNDVSKLWRHITPHLRSSLAQLYLRTASRYVCLVISFYIIYCKYCIHYILWTVLPWTAFLKPPCILYKQVKMGCFVRTKLYSQILCQIFIKSAVTNMAIVQNLRVYVQHLEYETTYSSVSSSWNFSHWEYVCGISEDYSVLVNSPWIVNQ